MTEETLAYFLIILGISGGLYVLLDTWKSLNG
jgi:hypothetical protein